MEAKQQQDREAFIAYWKDHGTSKEGRRVLLFYLFYLGGLAVYAFIVPWIDSAGWFWLPLFGAVGYLILVPYLVIRRVHRKFAHFIRCPNCGDWFGQDASGAYFGPNPKFRGIIETGRCSKCGEQILADP
jgi:hypothetical protein